MTQITLLKSATAWLVMIVVSMFFTPTIGAAQSWQPWEQLIYSKDLKVRVERRTREIGHMGTQVEWWMENSGDGEVTVINKNSKFTCVISNGFSPSSRDHVLASNLAAGESIYLPARDQSICAGWGGIFKSQGNITIIPLPNPWGDFVFLTKKDGIRVEYRSRNRNNFEGRDFELRFGNLSGKTVNVFTQNFGFICSEGENVWNPKKRKVAAKLAPGKTSVIAFGRICQSLGTAEILAPELVVERYIDPAKSTVEILEGTNEANRNARLKSAYKIILKNRCRRKIEIAVVYLDAETGKWSTNLGPVDLTRITQTQMLIVDMPSTNRRALASGPYFYVFYRFANGEMQFTGNTSFFIKSLDAKRGFSRITAEPALLDGERIDVTELKCS